MKLSHKFITGFSLLGILICVTSCTIGYIKYKNVIEKMYNDQAYHVAAVAASYVTGDELEKYRKEGKTDENYDKIHQQINRLQESMHTNYIYIAKLEGLHLTYLFDADNIHDAYPTFALGDEGTINPAFEKDANQIITTGKKSNNYFYSKSQFGYNTSAILPIYNQAREVVAIVGVEIAMSSLQNTLFEYIFYAIVISSILTVLFILCYLLYLSKTVLLPIKLITNETESFVDEQTKISTLLDTIKTGDEIELLAKAIHKMEIDINHYVDMMTTITAEKERIRAELNIATQIQADMLPGIFPAFPERSEFDIFATMQPAKEVGGDFYDFFLVDSNHLVVVIADVSGKGVPAALFMVITKTLIKNHSQAGLSPAEVFSSVNHQLCENNEAGLFVTAWMGVLEISSGNFTYVNAGHNPPFIKRCGGKFESLLCRAGFVLAGIENFRYHQNEMKLKKGDVLYLYTDGITEATDTENKLYGNARLLETLNRNRAFPLNELLPAIRVDIDSFVKGAPQFDDITMLGLKINVQNGA